MKTTRTLTLTEISGAAGLHSSVCCLAKFFEPVVEKGGVSSLRTLVSQLRATVCKAGSTGSHNVAAFEAVQHPREQLVPRTCAPKIEEPEYRLTRNHSVPPSAVVWSSGGSLPLAASQAIDRIRVETPFRT